MTPVRILICLVTAVAVGGCSWFREEEITTLEPEGGYEAVLFDNRILVDRVTALTLEPTPVGAIVRATGLPPRQEFWDADLVLDDSENVPETVLRYEFRVRSPVGEAPVGTEASRSIQVASFVTTQQLEGIRQIIVVGAAGSRTLNR